MNVFANGCSFTWGGSLYNDRFIDTDLEFDYNYPDELNVERLSNVWPAHLANLMQAESHVNLSMCGGSNERIVRTTMDFFTRPANLSKKWLAIIQWSLPERFEFYRNDSWQLVSPNFISPTNVNSEIKQIEIDTFLKATYSIQDRETFTHRHWVQVVSLANFFDNRNIDYRFIRLCRTPDEGLNSWQRDYLYQKVKWIKPYFDIGEMFNVTNKMPMGHPTVEGHKEIAQSIWKVIKNDYSN